MCSLYAALSLRLSAALSSALSQPNPASPRIVEEDRGGKTVKVAVFTIKDKNGVSTQVEDLRFRIGPLETFAESKEIRLELYLTNTSKRVVDATKYLAEFEDWVVSDDAGLKWEAGTVGSGVPGPATDTPVRALQPGLTVWRAQWYKAPGPFLPEGMGQVTVEMPAPKGAGAAVWRFVCPRKGWKAAR